MKSMKKVFAFLLTVSMVIGLFTMNIFAVTDGKITINNTNSAVSMKGHKYTAYKIFNVTYDSSKTNYNYTIADSFKAFFVSKGCNTDEAAYKYVSSLSSDAALQTFAKEAYAGKGSAIGTSVTANEANQVIISGLDHGYYLVYDEGNAGASNNAEKTVASAILTTTNPEVTVNLKADVPTLDKKITGVTNVSSNELGALTQDAVDAQIGHHIQFKLTSKVPDLTGYSSYSYTITDTLSVGLAFDNNVKVMIGGVDKTTECTITPNGQSFNIVVPYATLKAANKGAEVVVTYSATLNKNAVSYPDGVNTNIAKLEYSNNPNDTTSKDTTPDKIVNVYTFEMNLTKVDGDKKPLAGAEFTLKDAEGNYIAVTKDVASGKYIVDSSVAGTAENSVVVSGADGKIYVKGLKAGVYKLTEIKAPDGYNKLTEDVIMTIAATYNAEKTQVTAVAGNAPEVINKTGSLLPGTGGIGTTIFVVGGMGIMAAAVVLMILKKRKESKRS